MKKITLLICCLLSIKSVFSQVDYFSNGDVDYEDSTIVNSPPQLAVKFFPSQLMWRFSSYMVGMEHQLNESVGLEYRLGSIYDRDDFSDDAEYFRNKSGFKTSAMIKFYANGYEDAFWQPVAKDLLDLSYVGLELFYNSVDFERSRTFELDCGGDCTYFQRADYGMSLREIGVRLHGGYTVNVIGPMDLEFSWAVGPFFQNYSFDSRKPTDYLFQFGRNYLEDFKGLAMDLDLNLKVVYRIK